MRSESKGAFRYPQQEKKFPYEAPTRLATSVSFPTSRLSFPYVHATSWSFDIQFQFSNFRGSKNVKFSPVLYRREDEMRMVDPRGNAYRGRNDKR